MHWKEEVIGPVIFGNNYDPLQEVIINGEGRGRGRRDYLVIVTVQRGSCGSVCTRFYFTHTHLVQANIFGLAWYSGLKNTALQASMWTQKASCSCRKLRAFPNR